MLTSGKKRDQYSPPRQSSFLSSDPRLFAIQEALYESLRDSLSQVCANLRATQKSCIEEQITQEINQLLDLRPETASQDEENSTLAEKTLKALTTMNTKLQREIFNYLALKIKLAFAKAGVGIIGNDKNTNLMTADSAEEFFKEIEDRVAQREQARGPLSYQNTQQANEKVRLGFEHTIGYK